MTQQDLLDLRYMGLALALAEHQLGRTTPNPSVGCVIVRDGRILATGATSDGGRPHAEVNALASCNHDAAGATVYVTLEPCSFHGRTPPCADALIGADIARLVVACVDEHPRVDGLGLERINKCGIETVCGVGDTRVHALYSGFFHRLATGMPELHVSRQPARFDTYIESLPVEDLTSLLKKLGEGGCNRVGLYPDPDIIAAFRQSGHLVSCG